MLAHLSTPVRVLTLTIALAALLAVGAASARAAVTPTVSTKYYSFTGQTVVAMRADINRVRPGTQDASARGTVNWGWHHVISASGRCSFDRTAVTLREAFLMPRWASREGAPADVAHAWDVYIARLWVHEKGHQALSQKAANAVAVKLNKMGSFASCASLDTAANKAASVIMARQQQAQVAYDARTQHGATQGAVFG
ncbi:MAG: DUF922 domain-containing protein [Thermoleophilia bacterium]|nr:DUF922 domain-containing protein [Thermoleophilia bacterium]